MSGQLPRSFDSQTRPDRLVQVRTTSSRSQTTNTFVQDATTVYSGGATVAFESKRQVSVRQQLARVTEITSETTQAQLAKNRVNPGLAPRFQPAYICSSSRPASKMPQIAISKTIRSNESPANKTTGVAAGSIGGWRDKNRESLTHTSSTETRLKHPTIKMDARPYKTVYTTKEPPEPEKKTYTSPFTNRSFSSSAGSPVPLPAMSKEPPCQTPSKSTFMGNLNPFRVASKSKSPLKPGNMYIFNNERFESEENEVRNGSSRDVEELRKTFGLFQMNITLIKDAKFDKIRSTVSAIEKTDFTRKGYLVVAILSHGTRNNIIAAKDRSYSLNDDVIFPILRNRSLSNKPKIFLVQACKGSMKPDSFTTDASVRSGEPNQVLICQSTFEGYLSFRDEQEGTPFIQALCKHLKESGHTEDIIDIMRKVIRTVQEKTHRKQSPSCTTSLTEKFVFGDYCST